MENTNRIVINFLNYLTLNLLCKYEVYNSKNPNKSIEQQTIENPKTAKAPSN